MPVSFSVRISGDHAATISFVGLDGNRYAVVFDSWDEDADFVGTVPRPDIPELVRHITDAIESILETHPHEALQYSMRYLTHYRHEGVVPYDDYVLGLACAGLVRCGYGIAEAYTRPTLRTGMADCVMRLG